MVAPFSKFYGKTWVGWVGKHWKALSLRGFIFKPTEIKVLLKDGTRDFQNSSPFER